MSAEPCLGRPRRWGTLGVAALLLAGACSSTSSAPSGSSGTAPNPGLVGTAPSALDAESPPLESVEADPNAVLDVAEPLVLDDHTAVFSSPSVTASASGGVSSPSQIVPSNSQSTTTTPALSPVVAAKIQQIVSAYARKHDIAGISVGVVMPAAPGAAAATSTFVFGVGNTDIQNPVTATMQFEMGSETKTYTAGLLASLVAAGRVSLNDPLQNYVPPGVAVPKGPGDAVITLGNLATHQGGLPDEPANLFSTCPNAKPCPTAKQNYTEAMLWQQLPKTSLLWAPGTNWLYSNYGWGILGTVLANIIQPGQPNPPFGSSVSQVLSQPLGLSSTEPEVVTANLATPYGPGHKPVAYWNNTNALAGGGGLISDATDMGRWIAAVSGYPSATSSFLPTTLAPVSAITTMCKATNGRPPVCTPASFQMGMAWQLYAKAAWLNEPFAFKNGGTTGMHSTTYLVTGRKIGVTVLSNSPTSIDPLGQYIVTALLQG